MQVVIIDVKALLSIDSATSTKCGMKNGPAFLRSTCFRKQDDHLRICTTLMEEPSHGNEVQNLAYIPTLDKITTESERLLIVKKVVLLKHAKDAALCDHFHAFVQK